MVTVTLIGSVAASDGAAERPHGLSRYYASSGTPPGMFLGASLAGLDAGRGVPRESEVTEAHLENMLRACADPVSGEPVGGAPKSPRRGTPVAGFDPPSAPLSRSRWPGVTLADQGTKAVIYACHRRAVEIVLGYAEGEVVRSRSGANGVVEEDVDGVVAASFIHWSSRAHDPQLRDHLVVWKAGPVGRRRPLAHARLPGDVQGHDHPFGAPPGRAFGPVDRGAGGGLGGACTSATALPP